MEHRPTEKRRAEIVEALMRAMAQHGYERATIAKIAAEADLTPGLLHYHFRNKQQILLALLQKLVDDEVASLELSGTPREQLVALVERLLATGDSSRPDAVAAWVTISAEAIRQPEVRAEVRAALGLLAERVTAVIEAGDWSLLRPTNEIVAAFIALVQGYYSLAATARDLVPPSSAAPAARALLGALLQTEL